MSFKTFWQFLKKLNTNLTYDPAISLVGIYPREMNMNTNIYSSIIHRSQRTETTELPINWWIDRQDEA